MGLTLRRQALVALGAVLVLAAGGTATAAAQDPP
jgi:hypothetical protein